MGVGAIGTLSLPQVLRAEANRGGDHSKKSIINIYLSGGPSHLDMFDMKPDAPPEIRGEFLPISTNVAGMQICQHFPKLAKMADKFAIIRSITGVNDEHAPNQTESGWRENDLKSIGGHPSLGAVVAKLQGVTNGIIPRFIDLNGHTKYGFLGPMYSAFRPDGPGRSNLTLRTEITIDRLHHREQLLSELDRARRDADASKRMDAMDTFNQQAFGVITSSKLADALSIEKEDPKVRERYKDVNGMNLHEFLTARRLLEVGARVVSFSFGGWDTHSDNFNSLRRQLPAVDVGVSCLIEDLEQRGMLQDTIIVMWGEFGRSPRITNTAGRDHWSRAMSCFIAGGGLKTGQVIGSTNRFGETAQDNPVHLQQIFANLYQHMGIDPLNDAILDPIGRPQHLVDHPEVIRELIG
jgi:hypothetical protein